MGAPSTPTTCIRGLALLMVAAMPAVCSASLRVGFYDDSCADAEALVRTVVEAAFENDSSVAPALIRLHFHDCFVRGCDASYLLDSTGNNTAEKDADSSKSVHGYKVVDAAKAAVEAVCPHVVSCADILAFAARDSVALVGDIAYEVPAGRRDGTISRAADARLNLPATNFNAAQLILNFAAKNLTADEMVTLSGAHSVGVAHCPAFKHRLYNFSSSTQTDPTLGPGYAKLLRNICPFNSTATVPPAVNLDLLTPDLLDNKYYAGLQQGMGLLASDQALITEADLRAAVEENARHPEGWAAKFAQAMVKMGSIEVLTGSEGQIRDNCRVVNDAGLAHVGEGSRHRPGLAAPS